MSDYPESLQKFAIPPASKNMAGKKSGSKTMKTAKVDDETSRKIAEELDLVAKQGIISHGNKSPYVSGLELVQAQEQKADNELKSEPEYLDPFSAEPAKNLVLQMSTEPGVVEKYLSKSKRISLELTDGMFSIAVTDVLESKLSLLVLLPLDDNSTVFVPKPGTQIIVSFDGKSVKVYYPGTYVEVPELKTGFMSLIKADLED